MTVDALHIFSEKGFHPAEEIADRPTLTLETSNVSASNDRMSNMQWQAMTMSPVIVLDAARNHQ